LDDYGWMSMQIIMQQANGKFGLLRLEQMANAWELTGNYLVVYSGFHINEVQIFDREPRSARFPIKNLVLFKRKAL
jgi:hypothetical protein